MWLPAYAAAHTLHGCVAEQPQVTVLPAEIAYNYWNDLKLKVSRAPDGRSASVSFDGKRMAFARVDTAAQEKYSNGQTTLYLDGEKALMSSDSFVVAGPCLSAQPLPVAPMTRY